MKRVYLIAVAATFATVFTSQAQDAAEGQRRPGNPVIAALDANGDGTIDATEINNAAAALRKLDKNGDGKLTREELRPAGGGNRGANGERRRQQNSDAKK